jgi:VanZ family protein
MRPLAWLVLGGIVFVTISPINLRPHTVTTVDFDRALAYAVTGFIFVLGYPKQWKLIVLLLAVGAMAIEALQYISPSRHARFHDGLIKGIGAAIGAMAAHSLLKIRAHKAAPKKLADPAPSSPALD